MRTHDRNATKSSPGPSGARFTARSAPRQVVSPAPVFARRELGINAPGDRYEQEADRVAEAAMRRQPVAVEGHRSFNGACSNCSYVHTQRKALLPESPATTTMAESAPSVHAGLTTSVPSTGGFPLPDSVRQFFEPRFNHDFSKIRIHADDVAHASARDLHARAYAYGNHIVFGADQYRPEHADGRKLLAHELTHVVQQNPDGVVRRQPAQDTEPASRVQELQLTVHFNVNRLQDEAIDQIEAERGTRITGDALVRLRRRLNAIVSELVSEDQRPDTGQEVTLTFHMQSAKCTWHNLERCEYTITATHAQPKITPLDRVLRDTAYCTYCLLDIVFRDNGYAVDTTRIEEHLDRPYVATAEELAKIKDAFARAQSDPGNHVITVLDRRPDPVAATESDAAAPQSCDDLEPGLKESCEIDKAHKLAAVQAAEGVKSATCYGSKLDMALCTVPAIGAVRTVNKAGKIAEELNDVNKAARVVARVEGRVRLPKVVSFRGSVKAFDKELVRRAAELRETQAGLSAEAFDSINVAVARARKSNGEIVYLDAGNLASGPHSEEYVWSQLTDRVTGLGPNARIEQIFSERIPCPNCSSIIRKFIGEDVMIFYVVGNSRNRGALLRKQYGL